MVAMVCLFIFVLAIIGFIVISIQDWYENHKRERERKRACAMKQAERFRYLQARTRQDCVTLAATLAILNEAQEVIEPTEITTQIHE